MSVFNSSPDNSEIHYTYDGSFYGLLTVIFTAVRSRIVPSGIIAEKSMQFTFNARYIHIETDSAKAEKVLAAANRSLGDFGMKRLYYVFLSDNPEKEMIVYKYMMLGFKNGKNTNSHLTDEIVLSAFKTAENVSRETEKFRQFTRFSVMDGNMQYARIVPKNDILPILTPFFTNRLKKIPFVLHDLSRDICSVSDGKQWFITSSEGITIPEVSSDEKEMQALWKMFFDTIAIKERINPKLQMQMMSSRYFKNVWAL